MTGDFHKEMSDYDNTGVATGPLSSLQQQTDDMFAARRNVPQGSPAGRLDGISRLIMRLAFVLQDRVGILLGALGSVFGAVLAFALARELTANNLVVVISAVAAGMVGFGLGRRIVGIMGAMMVLGWELVKVASILGIFFALVYLAVRMWMT